MGEQNFSVEALLGPHRAESPGAQRKKPIHLSVLFLFSLCTTRARTSFLTSAIGTRLPIGNRMVPLDVMKSLSSFLNSSITDAVGNKLQWSENAANQTNTFLSLNAGIP